MMGFEYFANTQDMKPLEALMGNNSTSVSISVNLDFVLVLVFMFVLVSGAMKFLRK